MAARTDDGAPRRPAGSATTRVEARTALASVAFGAYLMIMAALYGGSVNVYYSVSYPLAQASVGTAFAAQICHIAIIYGMFVKRFMGFTRDLVLALSASLAVSLVTGPATLVTLICAIATGNYDAGLWEMARFGCVLYHVNLVRRLLRELQGTRSTSTSLTPTPPFSPSPPSPPLSPPPFKPLASPILAKPPPVLPPPKPPTEPPPPPPPTTPPPAPPPPPASPPPPPPPPPTTPLSPRAGPPPTTS